MGSLVRSSGARRVLRALSILFASAAAATCTDRTPVAPRSPLAPGHSRLSVAPSFRPAPPGAPVVLLSKIKGVLIGVNGEQVVAEAKFQGDTAYLTFDIQFPGNSAVYTLDLTGYDLNGVEAYHAVRQYTLKAGENPDLPPPVFEYSAPDAKVQKVAIAPSSTTIDAGKSSAFSVTGTGPNNAPISPVRVGWTSRDPSVATVDDNGLVKAGQFQGSTYIVARTVTNVADSALVKVKAPVDKVVLAPTSVELIRGKTATVTAQLRDAGNHLIDDRAAAYSTSDASVATVSSAGLVTGLKIGTATITATSEGKTATAAINVVTPIERIELTPASLNFASLKEVQTLTPKIVAKTGASVDGITATLTSSNPGVASVDASGKVTSVSNGTATIKASAEGVEATSAVTVQQVATSVVISPKSATTTFLRDARQFTATASDALGSPIPNEQVVFSTSDASIATVSSTGVATGLKRGTATITATVGTKSDNASFTVTQIPTLLFASISKSPIPVGGTAQLSASIADAGGSIIGPAAPVWTALDPSIATVSGTGLVTGVSGGTARFSASANGLTTTVGVLVTSVAGAALTVSPNPVEKLPNGTQTFAVTAGGAGPYTWSVNGVDGGNSTYGTIDANGNYVAPSTVPSPSSFDVCARRTSAPSERGCARVTINPIPTSGSDVIVFNDLNVFDGPGDSDPNNQLMFRNLVSFTGTGARASKTDVLFYFGHSSNGVFGYSRMRSEIATAGYTISEMTAAITAPIDAKYKVVFLWLPRTNFTVTEINNLKMFSAQGGRIVFIGEWDGYYGTGIGVENAFFQSMGAQMTNTGGAFDCGQVVEPASRLRPHQVTAGLTQMTVACASQIVPGPNDYPFLYDASGTRVLGAAAKVDVTPLPTVAAQRAPSRNTAPVVTAPVTVNGLIRDTRDPAGRLITPP